MVPVGTLPLMDDPDWWRDAMLFEARWQSIAGGLFFVESLCDRNANHSAPETTVLNFPCEQCTGAFASSKALASHMRAKQRQTLTIKNFLRIQNAQHVAQIFNRGYDALLMSAIRVAQDVESTSWLIVIS